LTNENVTWIITYGHNTLSWSNLYIHLDFLLYACCLTIMFWYVLQDDCMFIASQSCFVILHTRWSFSISIWQFQNFDDVFQNFNKMALIYIRKTQFFKKNPFFWFKRLEKFIPQKPLTQNVRWLHVECACYMLHFIHVKEDIS